MAIIDEIELRRLDLTVLLVFVNLMRLRKASDVADHMGLTQSSISHSIKRLRDVFQDPLFLRHPAGMAPTAVAVGLEPKIRQIVETLSEALKQPLIFDPATATDTMRIGAYDNEMATLVPGLLQRVRSDAPNMRISILPLGRKQALEALEGNVIDLAIGFIWDLPQAFVNTELYHEGYAVVFRKGHPIEKAPLDLDTYAAADHLVVSPSGTATGIVDDELARTGHTRNIRATLPHFLPALSVVSTSDLIATLPKRLVTLHAARHGLVQTMPPIDIRPFTVSTIVHERNSKSLMHDWIIQALKDTALV